MVETNIQDTMPPHLQKNQYLNIFAYSTATSTIWYHFQAKKNKKTTNPKMRDGYEKENRGWNKNRAQSTETPPQKRSRQHRIKANTLP